jgi:uncharacterized membrane protein (DUF2068 family)
MNRPKTVTAAALVTFVYSLYALVWLFAELVTQGEFVRNGGTFFTALLLIFFSMGVVAAYGIRHNQRWGKILAIVVLTFNGLLALPGILFGPTLALKVEAFIGVAVAVVVTLLLLGVPAARSR